MTRIGGALVALLLISAVPAPTYAQAVAAAPAPQLTVEQMRDFLKTAKIIRSRTTSKGITAPKRLTLSDGVITHDAVFQSVDERQTVANLTGGGRQAKTELNFVDSYRYNLGAYAVAGLLAPTRRHDVVPDHLVARADEARRHRRPHDAETDEADSRQARGAGLSALGSRR